MNKVGVLGAALVGGAVLGDSHLSDHASWIFVLGLFLILVWLAYSGRARGGEY